LEGFAALPEIFRETEVIPLFNDVLNQFVVQAIRAESLKAALLPYYEPLNS
jgi:hypothetical protein